MQKTTHFKKLFLTFILLIFSITLISNNYIVTAATVYNSGYYTKNGDVVYFEKPTTWSSSTPYIYAYHGSKTLGSEPGVQMTLVEGNRYKYTFTDNNGYAKVVFSDGSDTTLKTNALDFICSEYVYKDNLKTYTKKGDTIYYTGDYGSNTHIYLYNSSTGAILSTWPGKQMTHVANTTYKYELETDTPYDTIIFNNNSGSRTQKFNFLQSGTSYSYSGYSVRSYLQKGDTIFFEKPDSWGDKIYVYMWNVLNNNGSWKTKTMTNISGNRYSYTLSDSDNISLEGFDNIIFADNSHQTKDLSVIGNSITFLCNNTPITENGHQFHGRYDGIWVYAHDKTTLSNLISNISIPVGDEIYYTEYSYNIYKDQLNVANQLLNTDYVNTSFLDYQSQYERSLIALQFSYDNLKLDTTILSNKINEMKSVSTTNYTQASVNTFNASISDAESLLTDIDNLTIDKIKNAINNMNTAYNNLKLDKSDLQAAINNAKTYNLSIYTSNTASALSSAISDGETTLQDDSANYDEVQQRITNINNAISNLKIDKSELQNLVNTAKAMDTSIYTSDSVSVLTAAINDANSTLTNDNASYDEVQQKITNLNNAISGLKVDKTELQNLVNSAKSINTSIYTNESVSNLNSAIDFANTTLNNDAATYSEVENAKTKLNKAIADLVIDQVVVEKSALQALVNSAKAKDTSIYTKESVDKLNSAINSADYTLADPTATYDEVIKKITNLNNALSDLKIDKSELQSLVDSAKAKDTSIYTKETVDKLNSAINSADTTLNNNSATYSDVQEKIANLKAAITGLELDKSELQSLVNSANSIDAPLYTTDSLSALNSAIDDANTTLNNDAATYDEIQQKITSLKSAISALKLDKSELQELVKSAQKIDTSKYTLDSVSAFTTALNKANDVLENDKATSDDIKTQIKNLKNAISNLVKIDSTNNNNVNSGSNNNNSNNTSPDANVDSNINNNVNGTNNNQNHSSNDNSNSTNHDDNANKTENNNSNNAPNTQNNSNPKTGDNLRLLVILLVISVALYLTSTIVIKKTKTTRKRH